MIWILCMFTLFLSSCGQKPQERHYTEIIVEAPQANTPIAPAAAMFSWAVPQGWKQVAGGDMRLATFVLIVDPNAIDCYITTLLGPAGGIDANLERWLGQLGLQASDDHLKMLITSAQILNTKGGLGIKVFDFTILQNQGPSSAKSMVAAMIALGQTTVFVKMTGSIEAVKQNKDNFLKLLGSIVRQ